MTELANQNAAGQNVKQITSQVKAGIWLMRLSYAALLVSGILDLLPLIIGKNANITEYASVFARLAAAVIVFFAERQVWKGRPTQAALLTITTTIIALFIMGLVEPIRIAWLLGILIGLLLSLISIQLMPSAWMGRGIFIAFTGGSLVALTDFLDKSVNYSPRISDPQTDLLFILSIVIGVFLSLRFATYPVTAKLVLAIASLTTIVLNGLGIAISAVIATQPGISPEIILSTNLSFLLGSQIGIVLSSLTALLLARFITLPILEIVDVVDRIALEGDLSQRVKIYYPDEVGRMGEAFNRLMDTMDEIARNADRMAQGELTVQFVPRSEQDVLGITLSKMVLSLQSLIKTVTQSAIKLSSASGQLSSKTNFVAAAAEELSANTTSVATGMETASTNLHAVAAAVEEMTATIGEIAGNSEKAQATTDLAGQQVDQFSIVMKDLGQSAREIGNVTEIITRISSQTNLLALNATIEAARVGAAGKGFAVVANEIKELAQQTAAATNEIRSKIATIQSSTAGAVADIDQIVLVIREVNAIVMSIATAIQEQSIVTRDIAGNIAQASNGVRDVNARVAQTASVTGSIADEIGALSGVGGLPAGGEDQTSAVALSRLAEQLSQIVSSFKV